MAEHGGYRKPSNPAAVSGPGALSQRTDGGPTKMNLTGMSYGENGAANAQQSAAPLSAASAGGSPQGGSSSPPPPHTPPVGLGDPSAYPDQPVTAGADAGAGPGTADIGLSQNSDHEIRQSLGPWAPVFARMADSQASTPAFRRQVRQLLARIT